MYQDSSRISLERRSSHMLFRQRQSRRIPSFGVPLYISLGSALQASVLLGGIELATCKLVSKSSAIGKLTSEG